MMIKYGNNIDVANKTWRSMSDGIEMSDIALLGHPDTYTDHHNKLKSHITTTMIEQERRENSFYNLRLIDISSALFFGFKYCALLFL